MNDRENEIYKRGAEEVKNTYAFIHDDEFSCGDMANMFLKGAQYADQNPRKGLWDSEKVIKWLRANIDNYANYNVKTDECFVNDFEEDLLKAMED